MKQPPSLSLSVCVCLCVKTRSFHASWSCTESPCTVQTQKGCCSPRISSQDLRLAETQEINTGNRAHIQLDLSACPLTPHLPHSLFFFLFFPPACALVCAVNNRGFPPLLKKINKYTHDKSYRLFGGKAEVVRLLIPTLLLLFFLSSLAFILGDTHAHGLF